MSTFTNTSISLSQFALKKYELNIEKYDRIKIGLIKINNYIHLCLFHTLCLHYLTTYRLTGTLHGDSVDFRKHTFVKSRVKMFEHANLCKTGASKASVIRPFIIPATVATRITQLTSVYTIPSFKRLDVRWLKEHFLYHINRDTA